MAIYARDTLKRGDLKFFAFEPNKTKVEFIEGCVRDNGLEGVVKVVQCVLGDETIFGGAKVRKEKAEKFCEFDGRTSYEIVEKGSCCVDVVRESETSTKQNSDTDDEIPPMNQLGRFSNVHELDDGESCSGSSSSASSSSTLRDISYDIRRLDDFYEEIHPLGFLHLDVEGWEAKVLAGASSLLSGNRPHRSKRDCENDNYMPNKSGDSSEKNTTATEPLGTCYILAETFSAKEARRRGPGFSLTHERDILAVMAKYLAFSRGQDVVDGERNLFFARNGNS